MSKRTIVDFGVLTSTKVSPEAAKNYLIVQETRKDALIKEINRLASNIVSTRNCVASVTDVETLEKAYRIRVSYTGQLYDEDIRLPIKHKFGTDIKFVTDGHAYEDVILPHINRVSFYKIRRGGTDELILGLFLILCILYFVQMVNKPKRYDFLSIV